VYDWITERIRAGEGYSLAEILAANTDCKVKDEAVVNEAGLILVRVSTWKSRVHQCKARLKERPNGKR